MQILAIHPSLGRDARGHAAGESVLAVALVGLMGAGGLLTLGHGMKSDLLGNAGSRGRTFAVAAQAAVVDEAARFAQAADHVGYARWQAAEKIGEARAAAAKVGDAVATSNAKSKASKAVVDASRLLAEHGDIGGSRSALREAEALATPIEMEPHRSFALATVAEALANLGKVLAQQGKPDEARAMLLEARSLGGTEGTFTREDLHAKVAEIMTDAGKILALQGDQKNARLLLNDAQLTAERMKNAYRRSVAASGVDQARSEAEAATTTKHTGALDEGNLWDGPILRRIPPSSWLQWLPGDGGNLRRWGGALMESWADLFDAPEDALPWLLDGAAEAGALLLPADEFAAMAARILETAERHADSAWQYALSRTPAPTERAFRAVRAMELPEARAASRGLLATSAYGAAEALRAIQQSETLVTTHFVSKSASPESPEALRALFDHPDGERAWVLLEADLNTFSPAMTGELARLMDNHPEVFVFGFVADTGRIDPLLREKGRFGPLVQR